MSYWLGYALLVFLLGPLIGAAEFILILVFAAYLASHMEDQES